MGKYGEDEGMASDMAEGGWCDCREDLPDGLEDRFDEEEADVGERERWGCAVNCVGSDVDLLLP